MKITPFKMQVTPAQSKRIQKILFENGYGWYVYGGHIRNTYCPYIHLWRGYEEEVSTLTTLESVTSFNNSTQPELTFGEFMKLYDNSKEAK